jgi:hypothetical protein
VAVELGGLPDRSILFIGGLHRSGTSILHRIVRAHPEISGFTDTGVPEDEGQHLQTLFPVGLAFGGPGRFGFDPRAYMDESHPLATRDNAVRLSAEWAPHWDLGKAVLVEKTPLNLVRMRFLQALFPQAGFILILRHPIVVAFATWKYCRLPIPVLIEHSLRCYERAIADAACLKQFHALHYEDLIADTQAAIDPLWRFASVADHAVDSPIISNFNDQYFDVWQRERTQVAAEAEREQTGWLAQIAARCAALGYSLDSPDPTAK